MKYDKEKFKQHVEVLSEMIRYVGDDIIWEEQCGQPDHFDRLNKLEQIALIDIFEKIRAACAALVAYEHWFNN